MPALEKSGLSLDYRVAGASGRSNTVLMACRQRMFQGEMERRSRVMTFDQRGTGRSSVPRSLDAYTVAGYTSDLVRLVDHVGFDNSVVVGYSHAAYFAVDFALQHPDRVSALVLIEPALFVDKEWLRERIALVNQGDVDGAIRLLLRQITPELALAPEDHEAWVKAIRGHYKDPLALAGEWHARLNHELGEHQLQQLRVPTLVLAGERTRVGGTPTRVTGAIPRCSLVWIPGASHLLIDEKPAEAAAAIELFVRLHTDRSAQRTKTRRGRRG